MIRILLAIFLALSPLVAQAQTALGGGALGPVSVVVNRAQNTLALVGDSRLAQQVDYGMTAWGFVNWANYLDGHKYNIIYDDAISGATTRQYLSSTAGPTGIGANFGEGLQGALNSHARFVVIYGELNDSSTYTGDQIWDCTVAGAEACPGILQAAQQLIANGQIPVIPLEAGQNNLSGAKVSQIVRYNQLVREFCEAGNAICPDFPSAIWDFATTTATTINLIPNSTQDGTHPNMLGGWLEGKVFDAALSPLVPAYSPQSAGDADNLLTNSSFSTQTGGSISGGGTLSSGTIPSGWTIKAPSGVSVASAFVSDPSGTGSDWQLSITNNAGANPTITVIQNAANNAVAGQSYQAGGTASVASGATNFLGASLALQIWGGSALTVNTNDFVNFANVNTNGPTGAYSVTYQTPCDLNSPAGSSVYTQCAYSDNGTAYAPAYVLSPTFTANGSATITISHPWLRQR